MNKCFYSHILKPISFACCQKTKKGIVCEMYFSLIRNMEARVVAMFVKTISLWGFYSFVNEYIDINTVVSGG